ncbi:hypothetical protein IL992_43930 [Microbispora sp. NEAU-D428]|uniref:hypothetical protein n=1 Tax=Microbispora sitophila TaxID=2771537 RepID=UPI001865EE6A|nr:hypothetical protein [Microbispora sitophila]MBE3016054.1 hypothetical protein [Microbispora sitophila]
MATPRNDLIGITAVSEVGGSRLSISQVAVNALSLLAARVETTPGVLASIVATLLKRPVHVPLPVGSQPPV